ncbi:hypothetical protein PYCC9005_005602 [Savitreella phatthalungensis]
MGCVISIALCVCAVAGAAIAAVGALIAGIVAGLVALGKALTNSADVFRFVECVQDAEIVLK